MPTEAVEQRTLDVVDPYRVHWADFFRFQAPKGRIFQYKNAQVVVASYFLVL